jgi:hypothetical protein
MNLQNIILLSLSFLFLTCNEATDIGSNINKGNTNYTEGENTINAEFVGAISQSCPIGVTCDTSFDYHAYSGTIDSLHINIFFKPQWLKNKTYQGTLDYFNYLFFSLHLPSRENDSVFYSYNLNSVCGNTVDSPSVYSCITGYKNDTLSGIIKVKFQYLTKIKQSSDAGCSTGDIMGVCSETLDEPREYIIRYKIKLEE